MASLDQEMAVREHDLGWHFGRRLTRRCRDCARENKARRVAEGWRPKSRRAPVWVQDQLPWAA
jgi:hypothetical protein